MSLSFALGKALADVAAHDAAFTAYEVANLLRRQALGAAPQQRIEALHAIREAFDAPEPPHPKLSDWADAPRPIFIVGLPRSGTTLVERILAQHSEVEAGGEKSDLKDAILAEKDRFTRGLAGHLMAFALARELGPADQIALDEIAEATAADEYRIQTLIKEVISSAPFQTKTNPAKADVVAAGE